MTKTVTIQAQQKWDYCSESRRTENSLLIALNDLGQRGWELVHVLHHKDPKGEMSWTALLKRPSVGQAPPPAPQPAPAAVAVPSAQTEEKPAPPQSTDPGGNEYQLKTDLPEGTGTTGPPS
jgi:hypothetical protein